MLRISFPRSSGRLPKGQRVSRYLRRKMVEEKGDSAANCIKADFEEVKFMSRHVCGLSSIVTTTSPLPGTEDPLVIEPTPSRLAASCCQAATPQPGQPCCAHDRNIATEQHSSRQWLSQTLDQSNQYFVI